MTFKTYQCLLSNNDSILNMNILNFSFPASQLKMKSNKKAWQKKHARLKK